MRCRRIALMLIFVLLAGCSNFGNVKSPPKSIRKAGDFIFAEGRWKAYPGTNERIVSTINFTSLTCDRSLMTCREIEALLFTPKEHSELKTPELYSQEFDYKITNWTDDVVKAKRDAPVADIEIIISLQDNFAEKSFRETKARGSQTANPEMYGKWGLE